MRTVPGSCAIPKRRQAMSGYCGHFGRLWIMHFAFAPIGSAIHKPLSTRTGSASCAEIERGYIVRQTAATIGSQLSDLGMADSPTLLHGQRDSAHGYSGFRSITLPKQDSRVEQPSRVEPEYTKTAGRDGVSRSAALSYALSHPPGYLRRHTARMPA